MSKVTEAVTRLAEPVVEGLGLELWDVEYVREAGSYYLRIYIDKPGGVGIDDCEAVSKALDPILDEADPVPDSYVFEVSSPGLERELKQPTHFQHFLGEKVTVKLFTARGGRREYVGVLRGYEDGTVLLETTEGEERFGKKEYAAVRLYCEY